ncbi:DsbA family protein [Neptunomonas japonica]|uniref:DsbA family protein n=1 Tax=Neptunomonas japonica TaxID=417574 RepID=UPI0004056C6B|nr:DsbA family protein [Neptunomonas japonica]
MQLLYVMDPMCSWCWAFSPTIQAIKKHFPTLTIQYVMGGLATDSDSTMSLEQQKAIQSIWHQIEAKTGAQFNYDFWTQCTPRRSTWRACRAIIVADQLQPGSASTMAQAIQQAYYLEAKNPSDSATLTALATTIGIDTTEFSIQLDAQDTHQQLKNHMMISQQLDVSGFPALRAVKGQQAIRISDGYCSSEGVIKRLQGIIEQAE